MKNIRKNNILTKSHKNIVIPAFTLFLDIETTGFSGSGSRLYLIGTAYMKNGKLIGEQFLRKLQKKNLCFLPHWTIYLRSLIRLLLFMVIILIFHFWKNVKSVSIFHRLTIIYIMSTYMKRPELTGIFSDWKIIS
ncbi:hypothetical protein C823_002090 [Eubacterium plexicaudatum ASF492]|nr:hypothetical protein C823_002090 [Eubacterium plexicaudatum ASF492]